MNKTELIKKIHSLQEEVKLLSAQNKLVLEAHQVMSNGLAQYLRDEEDRLRNLKEELMLQVHSVRQDSAKMTNEYRQEVALVRAEWAKTFRF